MRSHNLAVSRSPFPMRLILILVIFACARPHALYAQPYQYPEGPALVDEGTAYAWTAGATFLPIAAGFFLLTDGRAPALGALSLSAGVVLGPSAGELYSGSVGMGLGMAGLRLLGGVVAVVAAADLACSDCDTESRYDRRLPAIAGILLGGSTVLSLVETHFAVHRHNRAVSGRKSAGPRFRLDPQLGLDGEGRLASGAALRMRF